MENHRGRFFIPKKFSCCSAIFLRWVRRWATLFLPAADFGKRSGRRTPRVWSGTERDISTGLGSEGLWVRAGKRGGSSEVKRQGSGTRVRARRDGQPERRAGGRKAGREWKAARPEASGQLQDWTRGRLKDRKHWAHRPLGGKVQEGVRVCWQRHDAKTASEHLAPFPILDIWKRGRLEPKFEPFQRQLMHTASCTCSSGIQRYVVCRNHI